VADASFNGFALRQVTLILLWFLSRIIMLIHLLYHSHFDFHSIELVKIYYLLKQEYSKEKGKFTLSWAKLNWTEQEKWEKPSSPLR
jgi:hypothetical protein